jgi:hypothetical protein
MDQAVELLAVAVALLGVIAYNTYRVAKFAKLCLGELSMTRWEAGCRPLGAKPKQSVDRVSD